MSSTENNADTTPAAEQPAASSDTTTSTSSTAPADASTEQSADAATTTSTSTDAPAEQPAEAHAGEQPTAEGDAAVQPEQQADGSTTAPVEDTPAPAPGADEGTEAPADEPAPEAEPEAEAEQPARAQSIKVEVELMLYEAGMVANSLSSKALGSTLADKLYAAEQAAESEGKSRLTFDFTPFEAGMALGSMGRVVDGSLDDLKQRTVEALNQVMFDLNIDPIGGNGGSVGGIDSGNV